MQRYNTINDTENNNNNSTNEINKKYYEYFCDTFSKIGFGICFGSVCILLVVFAIFAIYALFILIGIFIVLFNTMFESTIVYLFGRNVYNKNFPVCTSTSYSGNNCYTTTSTYCS